MFIQKYRYKTLNDGIAKEYRIGQYPILFKEKGLTEVLPEMGKKQITLKSQPILK